MTDQPSELAKPTLSEDMQAVVTHFRLLYPDEVPLKDSAERLWSGLADLEAKLAQAQTAERYWRAEFLAEEDRTAELQRKLEAQSATIQRLRRELKTAGTMFACKQEQVTILKRELAEARQRVNNHHREPCMTCVAMESERDEAKLRLERIERISIGCSSWAVKMSLPFTASPPMKERRMSEPINQEEDHQLVHPKGIAPNGSCAICANVVADDLRREVETLADVSKGIIEGLELENKRLKSAHNVEYCDKLQAENERLRGAAELACVSMEERGYGDMLSFENLRAALTTEEKGEKK